MINTTKSWFFKKVKIIDKSLAWLIKKKILRSQITNRNEIEITTGTMEIQKKKNPKRIVQIVICQQIGQQRRSGQISISTML